MGKDHFFGKIIQVVLLSVLLLGVVCGRGSSVMGDSRKPEPAGEEKTERTEPVREAEAERTKPAPEAETEIAALTQDEPEIEMQGNTLTYGGMIVEFPEGIEAKLVEAEDNGNIFNTGNFLSEGDKGRILDLCGAQEVYADRMGFDGVEVYLDLPPRVRLMHYTAAYDSQTAFLCALFDLLPDAVGNCMYEEPEKQEYAYCLQQDSRYLYLFFVKGEEVCLVQEIVAEEECSFSALLADGAVQWKDGGNCRWNPQAKAYKQEPGHRDSYAAEGGIKEEEKIPQGLLNEIAGVMAAGKDPAILSEMWDGEESAVLCREAGKYADWLSSSVSGRELTQEEVFALAERDMTVRLQVQDAARYNYMYKLVEADGDNDGRNDLVGVLYGNYIGGTSGNGSYVFWKGQPDGSYVETDEFGEVHGEFGVIAYEGKNYLCRATFDYGRMINDGYVVDYYEDGKRLEEAAVYVVPERYEIRQVSAKNGYEEPAADIAEACIAVKEQFDEDGAIEGKAERKTEQRSDEMPVWKYYLCDLDNDGQEEGYNKLYRHLANYYGLNYLELSIIHADDEQGGIAMFLEEMEENADTPVALWVETCEGKNIVNVLYMTGLDDYRVVGYLIEENGYSEVYEIQVDAFYKTEQERRAVY